MQTPTWKIVLASLALATPLAAQTPTPTPADSALEACAAAAARDDERAAKSLAGRAEELYRAQMKASPRQAAARVGLARVASQCRIRYANVMTAGRMIGESNRLLEEALELEPANWAARFTLAMNHYHTPEFLGRTGDAVEQMEILLRLQGERAASPQYALPYAYLGDLYQRSGRRQDAVALWERGARLFPDHPLLRTRLEKAREEEAAATGDAGATTLVLEGLTVRARRLAPDATVGGTPLDRMEVITAPGGAADLLQGVRMQGGVTQASDGSDLFVRGGEPAESPVWVDGGRIFYPGTFETLHGGLFGALNSSTLREALFFSGGFSARYGNALSGALDVTTEGRPARLRARGGVDMSGASATVFTPVGDRAGVWAGGRLTDAGLLVRMQGLADDFSENPRSADGSFGLVATPRDGVELKATGLVQNDGATREVESNGYEGPFRSRGGTRHAVLSARATAEDGSWLRAVLSGSERSTAFRFGVLDRERADRSAGFSLTGVRPVTPTTVVRAGVEGMWLGVSEEGWLPETDALAPGSPAFRQDREDATRHLGGFVEAEVSPLPRFSVVAGLRADRLPGEAVWTADPRLAVAYRMDDWTVRLGGGVFHQGRWRTGYRLPDAGTPSGIPRRARHLALGIERDPTFRVEGYLKEYDRYVPGGEGPAIEAARVMGADARLRWTAGEALSGWVVYSFLHGRVELEDGRNVPSRVDVTHGLTGVAKWAIGTHYELGATARYATGRPYSAVIGTLAGEDGGLDPVYGAVHGERLPTYSRLDSRLTRVGMLGKRTLVTYLEVLNALGQRNVMGYTYDASYQERRPVESFFSRRVVVLGVDLEIR